MKKIGILMGSDSDLPVVEKAITTLKEFDVPFEVHVFSAHRTAAQVRELSENARANGFGAIIAAAVYLASDEARYVTGATIDVNGGSHIH